MAGKDRRTVTHNRGDEVIEAGNIRFGIEMRDVPALKRRRPGHPRARRCGRP